MQLHRQSQIVDYILLVRTVSNSVLQKGAVKMTSNDLKKAMSNIKSSVGLTLFECLKLYKDRILQYLADTDEIDTYGQVLTRCIRTALKLKEKGIRKNDIISTCTDMHKNSCVPLIAAFLLGATPANFDPNLSPIDTVHLLKIVQPKIIFVSPESIHLMETCLAESEVKSELVVFGSSTRYSQFSEYIEPNSEEEDFRPEQIDDEKETAIILFSSGTTGLPKGICLSHYSILGHMKTSSLFLVKPDDERSVNLLYTTFYWISAVGCFTETILHGDAFVVCSKFEAARTWALIEKYKVTIFFLTTHLVNDFLQNRPKRFDVTSLKLLSTGGLTVTRHLAECITEALPNCIILNMYGQTEAGGCISRFAIEEKDLIYRKPSSCGKIRPILQWKVVETITEKMLGPNERGELRLKSDLFMNGYYKMDTSEAFDSEGYLKTGDIVYYDEDECIYVVDRIKEAFKYKGWHILPAILEEVLMSHPAVKEAAVIGINHETDGEHPMGIVVLYDEYKHVSPEEVEAFVGERVADIQKLRAGVKVVNKLFRTATGKVKRSVIKKMVLEGKI